ncbi:MAG: YceI family protein, partial [Jatrophihabitantaceae bacterium]
MTLAATIPGYLAGTWSIDPAHSDVSFSVRHMMVSKVKGRFGSFSGALVTAENPAESSVTAEIDLDSIDTNNAQRDNHIRSGDFFEVEKNPTMTFASTSVQADGGDWLVSGDLSLKGITKSVTLKVELNGI